MNKTLAITTIALVAVVMGMSAFAPAMADPPTKSLGQWKPCHTEKRVGTCVTGQPDICPVIKGNVPEFSWYHDQNNNNVQDNRELKGCFPANENPNTPRRI